MKERPLSVRGYVGAFAGLALAAVALWLLLPGAPPIAKKAGQRDAPALFGAPPKCRADVRPLVRATRLEQQGWLHWERYPYDPRDGVLAVLRLREAESCYRAAGLQAQAERNAVRALELATTLDVDYASSRLVLQVALEAGRWSVAYTELRRLLRLTDHVKGHSYADWLESVRGKVAVHANDHP